MAFGATVYNDTGNIVIDPDFRNMVLRSKTSLTFTTTYQSYGMVSGYVDRKTVSLASAVSPMIAFQSSLGVGLTGLSISGSTYTWTVSANQDHTCTVYIFDFAPTPTSTFGMQVFNGSSEQVFNSDAKYMKVVDFFTTTYANVAGGWPAVIRNYSAGSYAVALGFPRTIGLVNASIDTDRIIATSTKVSVGEPYNIFDFPNQVSGVGSMNGAMTIPILTLDVSGY
jgi:hypothetical protein